MIQAHNICLSFTNQTIFDHISFILNESDRIGLVGRNGSGKTTLLKAIIDPSLLDAGTVHIQSKKKIAYMPQEVVLQSNRSILDETLTTFSVMHAVIQEIQKLEKFPEQMAESRTIERYSSLQEQLIQFQPEILIAKTKKILMGLGFSSQQLDESINNLSVGWKMRIVLAKLLLQDADFYLFDEPTNHLDLIAREWFLDFLKQSKFGFILICHERYFLDELCNKILELELGKAIWYTGNYSQYIVQKEHNVQLLQAAYVQQQKEIKRKRSTIERFRASASKARMAQSMEKALEKIEPIVLPPSLKNVQFSLPEVQQSGKVVIQVTNVSQKFNNKLIFEHVSFEIKRQQKVALIAPNGVGKTTLFNLIAQILPLQQGTITFGHNVTYAIFAQDQNKVLNPALNILDNIKQLCPKVTEQKIRSILGAFLFSGNDALKKVAVLSGGEKNRVGMVSVLLQNANLLLLDEPTNHLDIPSKDILLQALKEFKGTLFFVSHDRDFINAVATDIIELTAQGAYHFQGNYHDYQYQKRIFAQDSLPANQSISPSTKLADKSKDNSLAKKIKQIEQKIGKIEKQLHDVQLSFADITYGTPEFKVALEQTEQLKRDLQKHEEEWEQLHKELSR